jgi:predicted PurR-regulated permease PerM
MLIVLLSSFIGFLAIVFALYAVYAFMDSLVQELQRAKQKNTEIEKENEKLRFENKRKQLIINRLENEVEYDLNRD